MYPIISIPERLADRIRTMQLVKRNPQAVQNLYITGIRLCNTEAESQAHARELRQSFRVMLHTALPPEAWPESFKMFMGH